MKKEEAEAKEVQKKKQYERPTLFKYQQLKKVVACPD